ncbi:tRNA (adenosine(37)-N6)-dimethylallyltransferase MiaA [Actinomyces naeslundii]|uniref:tRNA (adenosine(37)-N6)-dimethylallyltransferase MiaA n=1 Tax=Actinomyces naeslundii TaxID=1655 RepID=UPI00094C3158|nr:tRNA (adenosine(37)-N6)-dimethylallyltransferase MiaA [Actinomyces naeslundii]OLO82077.1 tRNA (adenosine(37)-N6)-dimethylallyltransferase MiaA [Actinomyces naeslundii]OLO88705.1 tRNA (adenosine(37)-N6)-dimethylallyltransferase MiaA [Actinomyces naeslundii]
MSSAASDTPRPVRVAVVGPTATGKSDLALALAEQAQAGELSDGAEIINADASLLYRGMDIGTAKPSPVERVRVPHHQIDVLSVRDRASVAAFQRAARSDIEGVESRGNLVIIAGGSGLYVRALTDGLDFPGTDPQVRTRLAERAEREGTSVLYAELTDLDPVAAERIEASNTRRIVRALEVIEITGRPFSASLPRYEDVVPTVHIALRCERRLLDLRINSRAHAMFERGLVEEVETLIGQGIREGETAPRAIGYAQALAVIDGTMSVSEAVDSTALATRQLASRQIKWFRRDPRVRWIDVELTEDGRCTDAERSRVTRQARELVLAVDGVA